jgi:hypothetical protein
MIGASGSFGQCRAHATVDGDGGFFLMAQTGNHKGLMFGIFLAPFHRVGENPTLGMARDMELIEWLDELGYDEAWIGEHHSAGWETISAPEVFGVPLRKGLVP